MTSTAENPDRLSTVCQRLVASSQTADNAVREYVNYYPAGRQDVAGLLRALGDIRMAAGLLQRNDDNDSAGQRSASVAPNVRPSVLGVVRCAVMLVDLVAEILRQPDRSRENWLQDVASSLSDLAKQAETLRMALDLGLDSLLFAESEPASNESDLPPYQTTQIIQLVVNLRARVMDNDDNDESSNQGQTPALLELLDSVQQYIEQTSSSLLVPSAAPAGPSSVPSARSDVASVRSDGAPPPPPAVDAIPISHPAPDAIGLRYLSKTDIGTSEILEVNVNEFKSKLVVSVSSLELPIKMIDLTGNTVSGMSQNWGIHMTFCETAPIWAYLTDADTPALITQARYRDDFRVRRPTTLLYNRLTGQKLQTLSGAYMQPLAFSRDGTHFAMAKPGGRIFIMHAGGIGAQSKKVVHGLHIDDVTHGVFTPDSRALVSISRDGTIRLTDPETGESLAKLDVDTWKRPQFLGVTPDGHVIVSIWGDTVYRWEYETGSLDTYVLSARRRREGRPIAISPDCRLLACSTHDGVDVSDLHTGRPLHTIRFHGGYVTAAAFSPDGRYLALGKAAGGLIRVSKATLDVWEIVF